MLPLSLFIHSIAQWGASSSHWQIVVLLHKLFYEDKPSNLLGSPVFTCISLSADVEENKEHLNTISDQEFKVISETYQEVKSGDYGVVTWCPPTLSGHRYQFLIQDDQPEGVASQDKVEGELIGSWSPQSSNTATKVVAKVRFENNSTCNRFCNVKSIRSLNYS